MGQHSGNPLNDPRTTQLSDAAEHARMMFMIEAGAFLSDWFYTICEQKISRSDDFDIDTTELREKVATLRKDAYTLVHKSLETLRWSHKDDRTLISFVLHTYGGLPSEIEHRLRQAMAAIESILREYNLVTSNSEWEQLSYPKTKHYYSYNVDWSPAMLERWREYSIAAKRYQDLKAALLNAGA